MPTFDFQHQIGGGGVANEACRSDAPEVVAWLWAETNAASCHHHITAGTQAALLKQLETFIFSVVFDVFLTITLHIGG